MDYEPSQPTPSLDSILATLSSYAPPQQAPPSSYSTLQPAAVEASSNLFPYHNLQGPYLQPSPQVIPPHGSTSRRSPSPSPQPSTIARPSQASASPIISWPPALRYVTSLVQNPEVMYRIRHLIQQQHDHERQWWRSREELVKKQKGRSEARWKLDGVLKGLGGHVVASDNVSDPKADARELDLYDKKVHIACGEMIAATEKELQALRVPFFGIKAELISCRTEEVEGGRTEIGRDELQSLRGMMVTFLEDFCME